MAPYATVLSSPDSPTATSRRSSFASLRRPSASSFRFGFQRAAQLPDPDEMDAAFDGPEDDERGETQGLLAESDRVDGTMPGQYDFERDYTLPPSSPPPFQPYSSHHPAPGNTNGIVPTSPVVRPAQSRHFLGGILPIAILPRQNSPLPGSRVIGARNAGVFANLAARPDQSTGNGQNGQTGPEYVSEVEQKEGPPSYQQALRDAVPTYWDTTVVVPPSSSPFGPLSSSMSGDEILIDGMPSGNLFGFLWNMIVSLSFQFIGFLLTYVLHTTHAAKYGSRVGLGLTLIQFGLNLRAKAEELITSGEFPTDPSDPDVPDGTTQDEIVAENTLKAFWGPNSIWPVPAKDPSASPDAAPVILHNVHEAEEFALAHNMTLVEMLGLPSAADVGHANEYFSFMLMSIGWFFVLTSVGGWWRVKRFERGLKQAQRESAAAQAAAAANRDGTAPVEEITTAPALGPTQLAYYTVPLSQAWTGIQHIQQGFLGMHGRIRGDGHAPLPQDEHELLDAQGFGLEPMAAGSGDGNREGRSRGLWGI